MTQPDQPVRAVYPELFDEASPVELETFVEKLEQYCTSTQPPEQLTRFNFVDYTLSSQNLARKPGNKITRGRVGWRRGLLVGLTAVLVLLGIALAIPQTREALAGWFGFTIEQHSTSGFVVKADRAEWATEPDANFVYNIIGIPQERWAFSAKWPAPALVAGSRMVLPGDKILSVPAYLPEGYRWQTAALPQTNLSIVAPHFWSMSSRGGGGGSVPVHFDQDMALYLVGGNKADDLLLVSQYDMSKSAGILIYPFFVGKPVSHPTPPAPVSPALTGAGAPSPTPTPVAATYQFETELGLLAQSAPGQKELKLEIGAVSLHETKVKALSAWWYEGTWDYEGNWVTSGGWINLIWEQNGVLFQITGQHLLFTELLKIAESLPDK